MTVTESQVQRGTCNGASSVTKTTRDMAFKKGRTKGGEETSGESASARLLETKPPEDGGFRSETKVWGKDQDKSGKKKKKKN